MLEIYIPFSHKSNNICKQDPVSTMQKTGWTSHSSLWMRSLVQDSRAGHWSSALDLVVFENNPFGKALVEDQDSGHWQWLVVIKRAIKVWSAEWPSLKCLPIISSQQLEPVMAYQNISPILQHTKTKKCQKGDSQKLPCRFGPRGGHPVEQKENS